MASNTEQTAGEEAPKAEEAAAELHELSQYVEDLKAKISAKAEMRAELANCQRPSLDSLRNLDSSIKKNNAFVKKLKVFSASQLSALLHDMAGLNLSKYISELCYALTEAKLKMTDVSAVLKLCAELYKIYDDFELHLTSTWQKILPSKPGEKVTNASKLRVDIRLYAELVSAGIIATKPGLAQLSGVLCNLINQDKEQSFCHLSIILSFCRHCGEEYAGLRSTRMCLAAAQHKIALPKSDFMHEDKQRGLRTALCDYYKQLCQHLLKEHESILAAQKRLQYAIDHHGEVSEDRQQKYDMQQATFDKFVVNAKTLSDLLGESLPEFRAPEAQNEQPGGAAASESETLVLDPWGDSESKSFYTDLPDLRGILPNFSAPKFDPKQAEEPAQLTDEALEVVELDDNEADLEEEPLPEPLAEAVEVKAAPTAAPAASASNNLSRSAQFDAFIKHLFDYVNQESMDTAAITFLLQFNIRSNRKRLTTVIYNVPRTRLDLLPLLARFVAIINMVQTDVANELAELLRKNLRYHLRRRDQLEIESKIKTVRFIGELTKFGLYKKFDALAGLKLLLHNFQHHQVDMVCALFEVAGQYLYNCKDSRCLTDAYLEQLWRKKTATVLDPRHVTLVESVYYLIKPPEHVQRAVVQRTPMEQFIRFLIFEHLNKQNVVEVVQLLRKLHWEKEEIREYAVSCMTKAYLLRYPLISALALLVRLLKPHQPFAVMLVVDNVFEDIRVGLEIHSPLLSQRRMAMAKYLGKLFSYDLIDSQTIINTLYSIISLGVDQREGADSPLDPPDSLFRVKLACTLLSTVQRFLSSSMQRRRLKYFILFFQSYYWYKKSNPVFSSTQSFDLFPVLVDHAYHEAISSFDSKFRFAKSYEEALQALAEAQERLEKQMHPRIKHAQAAAESEANKESTAQAAVGLQAEGAAAAKSLAEEGDGEDDEVDDEEEADDDDDDDEEDEEDEDDDPSEAKSEQQTNEPAISQEDLEFEQMFQQMFTADLNERSKEPLRRVVKDIPVPMIARKLCKIPENSICTPLLSSIATKPTTSSSSSVSQKNGNGGHNGGSMPFLLMTRSAKNKTVFKQFTASADSDMAINFQRQKEEIRMENEKVKKLTLNMTERLEEEDDEACLHSLRNTNYNGSRYHRKEKFRHQKGVPDADHIFK